MSYRNRRTLMTAESTDKDSPVAVKSAFEALIEACDDRASAHELLKNKTFVALVNYLDEVEENDYNNLRALQTPEKTNHIRGRLDYLKMFREFMILLNQR